MRRSMLLVALAGAAAGQECQDITLSNGGMWHSGNQPSQTCAAFRSNGWCPQYKNCCTKNENMDPERACCGCGGGCTDAQVRLSNGQVVAWTDRDGAGCSAWADRCSVAGNEASRMHGLLPREACCACGGGSRWRPVNPSNPSGDWSRVDMPVATATVVTLPPVTSPPVPAPVPVTQPPVTQPPAVRTCSSHTCPEGFVAAPGSASTPCSNNVCGNLQCCVATCRQHSCMAGWSPNWDMEFVGCTNGVCTSELCCTPPVETTPTPASVPSFCRSHTALSGSTGTLSHPTNGGQYANNEGRCWSIACASEVEVTITRLDLEETYDFLYVYQLTASGVVQTGDRHDGTLPPPPMSIGGDALIRFTSDEGVTRTGFTLSWTCGAAGPSPVTGPTPVTGGGSASCSGSCTDRSGPNGQEWFDADGAEYNCAYYASTEGACNDYGDGFDNFGLTANQACCACGGGRGGTTGVPEPSGLSPSSLPSSNGCGPRIRQPWSTLSCEERQRYLDAVRVLYTDTALRQQVTDFVETHVAQFAYAHSTSGFLAWHRQYLLGYENLIRSIPRRHGDFACLTIPFWDWDRDAGNEHATSILRDSVGFGSEHTRQNPHCHRCGAAFGNTCGSCDFMEPACITTGPFADLELNVRSATPEDGAEFVQEGCITRAVGDLLVGTTDSGFSSTDDVALMIRSTPDFTEFRSDFELEPHAMPHLFTAGTMASDASPADPMFLVHHCNVDRIYAVWQDYWGHDGVEKADLCDSHYAPTDDWDRGTLDLDIDAVMPMEKLDGERMSTLRDRWTVRDVHHIHDMPGGNSYAYGNDALAHMLNSDPSFWGTVIPGRSGATVECGRRTERAAAEQSAVEAAHYTDPDLSAMSEESARAAEVLEWSDDKRMCEFVQAACDAEVAHHSLGSTPKMRAAAMKMFKKATHNKKAIHKAMRKCGALENALQWCKEQ